MSDRELLELQEEIETLKAELAAMKRASAIRPHGVLRRLLADTRARLGLGAAVVAIPLAAYAAQISVPNTFVNGTIADATEVNANFSTLVTESNAQDSRLEALEASVAANASAITTNANDVSSLQIEVGTNIGNITANTTAIAANASGIATNASSIGTLQTDVATHTSDIGDLFTETATNASDIGTNATDIATLNTTFAGVSRVGPLLTFSGMNVRVNDGSGGTDGAVNGLGNLIVGYNENDFSATRTGSHNLVVGVNHEYTSYAGMVAGERNTISGISASVSGGFANTASGNYSSVSGGEVNDAGGPYASVSGGRGNWAGNLCSGGTNPGAQCVDDSGCTGGGTCGTNERQSVSGGLDNTASGNDSSVSGGFDNTASGPLSSVIGGWGNEASGHSSSVSGGGNNTASVSQSNVVGNLGRVFVDSTTVH